MPAGAGGHWDEVFAMGTDEERSWYQRVPEVSLRLVRMAGNPADGVVDIGSGTSGLAGALLDEGFTDVTVLDVSSEAIGRLRRQLGGRAEMVRYVVADVLAWQPSRTYGLWHDRAVFHFLVEEEARRRYAERAAAALRPGGAVVLGTFAPGGPERCSGLLTAHYDAPALAQQFAPAFVLEHHEREAHVTPAGVAQPFTWVVLRRS